MTTEANIDPKTLAALEETAIQYRYSDSQDTYLTRAPRRYNYTALSTAKTCPRRYVLEYVLDLPSDIGTSTVPSDGQPVASMPDQPSQSIRVGTLFHTVVEQCWPAGLPASVWKSHGAAHAAALGWDDCRERVETLIDAFFESPVADWEITPAQVEVRFDFDVDGRTVSGAIDAIPVRNNGQAVILDYITGQTTPSKEQLMIYLLAAHRDDELSLPAPLSDAAFLRADGDEFTLDPLSVRDLESALTAASEVVHEWITTAGKASYGDPVPGDWCTGCPYRAVCDAAEEL
jgi:hypothetical protein